MRKKTWERKEIITLIVMIGFGYDIFEGFLLFGCSSFNGEFGCEIGMDRLKI